MKNARPTQMFALPDATWKSTRNTSRLSMKNRYATAMNWRRGRRLTRAANGAFTAIIAMSVPVKSHDRLFTPPATPASSRMGRNTEYDEKIAKR
jgi:hypothetical protein